MPKAALCLRKTSAPAHHADNAFRGHLAELGIIEVQGQWGLKDLIVQFHAQQSGLPELARAAFRRLTNQIGQFADEIGTSEQEIVA